MPIVKVYCLRDDSEDKLRLLHRSIVNAFTVIPELKVKDENDLTCLFPADLMKYGLGTDIIVEVDLFRGPERTPEVCTRIAQILCRVVKTVYPSVHSVECWVYTFNPEQGFHRLT